MLKFYVQNPEEFERMYAEQAPRAIATARRILRDPQAAEDVVQDVFLQLWRRPHTFDPARGSLDTYVRMLVRSRALDRYRSEAARRAALDRAEQDVATRQQGRDALDPVIEREGTREVLRALDKAPATQRQAVLAAALGLTGAETAELAGVPLGTAKGRLRLGLARARQELAAAA